VKCFSITDTLAGLIAFSSLELRLIKALLKSFI